MGSASDSLSYIKAIDDQLQFWERCFNLLNGTHPAHVAPIPRPHYISSIPTTQLADWSAPHAGGWGACFQCSGKNQPGLPLPLLHPGLRKTEISAPLSCGAHTSDGSWMGHGTYLEASADSSTWQELQAGSNSIVAFNIQAGCHACWAKNLTIVMDNKICMLYPR
jgi:hypothetical protein